MPCHTDNLQKYDHAAICLPKNSNRVKPTLVALPCPRGAYTWRSPHSRAVLKLRSKSSRIASMKGMVFRYCSGVTLVVPCTQMAKSCTGQSMRQASYTPTNLGWYAPNIQQVESRGMRAARLGHLAALDRPQHGLLQLRAEVAERGVAVHLGAVRQAARPREDGCHCSTRIRVR